MTHYTKEPHTTIFTTQAGCGKTHLVLDLITKKNTKNILTILPSYVQRSGLMKRTMTETGSKMMTGFGLRSLSISISGLESCRNC